MNKVYIESFFAQDFVNGEVSSFAIGQLWLYFYRETLIGVYYMESDDEAYILDATTPLSEDGFSSRHLITAEIIGYAANDMQAANGTPKPLSLLDLIAKAAELTMVAMAEYTEKSA